CSRLPARACDGTGARRLATRPPPSQAGGAAGRGQRLRRTGQPPAARHAPASAPKAFARMTAPAARQRIDVWLFRARFAKTRAAAARLVGEGGVRVVREGTS